MPYGLLQKLNTPANNAKMERCVADLMANPDFKPRNPNQDKKSAAVAVCKASIMGKTKAGRSHKAVIGQLRK